VKVVEQKDWTFCAEVYIKELQKQLMDKRIDDKEATRIEGIIEGIEFCLINNR
jgi:hypothetical protein